MNHLTLDDVKAIAIYLPQFHPFKENDEWWGKGFTEWTNVTKSAPKFKHHYQPHLPTDLGFYDLRLLETMIAQAQLAKSYGIHGFCFYHYWFNGKLLMERPIEQMLNSKNPNFPFCLCWANENWTRRWDGLEKNVLIKQDYNLKDDYEHIKYLIPFFKDERYIKIDGKPVFLVYRSELHPQINEAVSIWREEVKKAGFEDIYLIRVENFLKDLDPKMHDFDASMEFAPDFAMDVKKYSKKKPISHFFRKLMHKTALKKSAFLSNNVYDYKDMADIMSIKSPKKYKYFRSVFPSWDNSARRKNNATIFVNSSPEKFQNWVEKTVAYTKENFEGDERIIFINAWNEWAEGCHLEPDQKYGHSYLQALKNGLKL
ncbi:glycosyltransferase WbsX family protein [Pedobacter nototheniae]|uniref:glycosyltransferase WbsX family protein n=1 Tax=Pedobacter nototheniae TaxID=2488994 RepID=UPI00103F46B0|nr:glycoside hydrolase family 99-like domain-containing protein [Pedobacter nototheniae]